IDGAHGADVDGVFEHGRQAGRAQARCTAVLAPAVDAVACGSPGDSLGPAVATAGAPIPVVAAAVERQGTAGEMAGVFGGWRVEGVAAELLRFPSRTAGAEQVEHWPFGSQQEPVPQADL